jgi:hypothetical protein
LRNILSWGDQPIPQPVEEVVDLELFTYDKKHKYIVKRTHRKRKVTLDKWGGEHMTEEVIIDTKKAKASQLYSTGLAISHASYDKALVEEKELEQARTEIASLKHQVQYHQEVGGETNFKADLLEIHGRRLEVQKDLIMKAVALQEESLLFGITYKDIQRWDEKGAGTLEKVEFIQEIQKKRAQRTII